MKELADIVLKHDGYIYGEYVWALLRGEEPKSLSCRFVSKSLFSINPSIPSQLLIDLKQKFGSVSVRKDTVHAGLLSFKVSTNSPVDELRFMTNTDFTCNLLDYRRDGLVLSSVPEAIAYDISPYDTVVSHIKTKTLVPVNLCEALKTVDTYVADGWTGNFLELDRTGECSVCQECLNTSVSIKLSCSHCFHTKCLKQWLEKTSTCPLCRGNV